MIDTAVILAAGLGSRLQEKTADKPKGFLPVNGSPLIERSIEQLKACGISNILIGTGYLSEHYEALAATDPLITTVKSHRYQSTSSMFTLHNMLSHIHSDFLLLESDLLYETRALTSLLKDPRPDIILASGQTHSGDEVYMELDSQGYLVSLSKKPEALKRIDAELVGISKISLQRCRQMCALFNNQDNEKLDYEEVMVHSSATSPFPVKKIDKLIWCEIDDNNHYQRALSEIVPQLEAAEDNHEQ